MIIWLQELGMQILIWILGLLDSIFSVFKAAAGITKVNTLESGSEGVSLGTYFLQLDGVQKAFWVICIVSVAICAVCTVAAVIKSIVNLKGGETKSSVKIAGQSLGSMIVALVMATIMVAGITASDKLLQIVNKEINNGEQLVMSREILNVSTMTAYPRDVENVQGLNEFDEENNCTYVAYLYRFKIDDMNSPVYYELTDLPPDTTGNYIIYLKKVGNTFVEYEFNEIYTKTQVFDGGVQEYKITDFSKLTPQPATKGWGIKTKGKNGEEDVYYSKTDISENIWEETPGALLGTYRSMLGLFPTGWHYNGKIQPDSFNFLIAFLCAIIVLVAVIGATLGLIKRLFDLVLLFLALPGICATIPLDDGAKFKLWRETVISKIMLAFGSVLAVNIFAIVAPTLWNVEIYGAGDFTNNILRVLLICGGALTISGGQLLFARLVGGDAGESREMAQSARTMLGGAMTTYGLGKATGRLAFGQKNANGQRIGGLFKTAGGALGTVGGGAVNGLGSAVGGQAYRSSKFGRGASSVQRALKGFSGSAGWSAGAIGSAVRDVPQRHVEGTNDANGYETPGAWDKGLLGRWTQRGQQAANLRKGAKLAVKSAHFKPGKTNLGKINNTNKKK